MSWHEAAAYAEFAGKSLPTIYHWSQAAGISDASAIVPASNFSGKGLATAGSYAGAGPFGTYDMAGNAKEWCLNLTGDKRFILGGAWNEPPYMFTDADAQPPFSRADNFGFRLVKFTGELSAVAPMDWPYRDFNKERPVSDTSTSSAASTGMTKARSIPSLIHPTITTSAGERKKSPTMPPMAASVCSPTCSCRAISARRIRPYSCFPAQM